MMEFNPTPPTDATNLEAWFADAGLTVTVIARCPDSGCSLCSRDDLADAA